MLDFDDDVVVGYPFKIKINIKNFSSESRSFSGQIGICSCFNNSTPYKRMKNKLDVDQVLSENEGETK